MVLLQDGILAFFSAVGVASLIWLAAGLALHTGCPKIPGLLLVLPVKGDAPAMEADFQELRRVQNQLHGATILLADCGLTEDTRSLARFLVQREEHAELIDPVTFHIT